MSQTTQKIFRPLQEALAHNTPLGEERQGEAYMAPANADARKLAYIETYGCQMNFSDTEIIASMLTDKGYGFTPNETEADLVLINTCSTRETAIAVGDTLLVGEVPVQVMGAA